MQMRHTVYSLLALGGTLKSQMVMISTLSLAVFKIHKMFVVVVVVVVAACMYE